jgi:hypothetical protein
MIEYGALRIRAMLLGDSDAYRELMAKMSEQDRLADHSAVRFGRSQRRVEVYDGDRLVTVFTLPVTTDWVKVTWRPKTADWQSEVALDWDE